MSGREPVAPEVARSLRMITGGMLAGLTAFAGVVVYMHLRSAAVPEPNAVRLANFFTIASMGAAFAGIVVSELLWRRLLRRDGDLSARVRGAFVVRLATREAAAFVGLVAAFLAARGGVLRAYPAYWVDLAPYALFASFAFLHWPSEGALADEVAGVLGS